MYKKFIFIVLLIAILMFLSGCVSTPAPAQTEAPKVTVTTTLAITQTPRPVRTIPPQTTRPPTTTAPTTTRPPTTSSSTTTIATSTSATSTSTTTTSTSTSTTSTTTSTTTTTLSEADLTKINAPRTTPIPPNIPMGANLEPYLVDVEGYDKTIDTFFTEIYDISAKYTIVPIKVGKLEHVKVELFTLSSQSEAVAWMRTKEFANNTESRDWRAVTFMGYPASYKNITFTISDREGQEVFIRVAVGNMGVFSKFTQSLNRGVGLTPMDDAKGFVEEVTAEVILALEK